jgi:transcriptional regulator with XRE-family HTH domain
MLIFDMRAIGNKLLAIRKKTVLTQAEVSEAAGLSDRTYADIERVSVNMRIDTILKICEALHITPDEILTETSSTEYKQNELFEKLSLCSPKERETELNLLEVYLQSLIL